MQQNTLVVISQRIIQAIKHETMSSYYKQICRKSSVLLNFLLFFQLSFAQYNFGELDKKLDFHKKDLGGKFAVLIYKNNKIVYDKNWGDFNKHTSIPIASCSKWLTAAMVMTLVDEGKISLDDKVSKYLPIFATYGKNYITLRHCLSNETGIKQDESSFLNILHRGKYASLDAEVSALASKKEIDFNPGTGFFYGNAGFIIAARVCEIVTKRNFNQLMLERIFRPLGMRTSTFQNDNYNLPPDPSGGAKSTAEEYLNFLIMLLNKGIFKEKRILSEASIAEMEKPQMTLDMIKYTPKAAEGFTYGLGEWIMDTDTNGNSTVLASPGLFGTWPMIDRCRGYAVVFFVKSILGEGKKNIYSELKKIIDQEFSSNNCK